MSTYDLTEKQQQLLKILVEYKESGKHDGPIIAVVTKSGGNIIGIPGDFGQNLVGDLEVLCEIGLLSSRPNSKGNNIYTVKQSGFNAVKNDFKIPETQTSSQVNIGAIVNQMSGGNLQAIGYANKSEIQQIVNNSELLVDEIDKLTSQLFEAVKGDLSTRNLVAYAKLIEDLKKEVAAETPSQGKLQGFLRSLAFLGDVEGSISLMARVWLYIYPVLEILSQINIPLN